MAASQSVLEGFAWVELGEYGRKGAVCVYIRAVVYVCAHVYIRIRGYLHSPVQLRLLRQASE